MAKFPFSIVGFDLDGTLVDSSRDLGLALNHALELAGLRIETGQPFDFFLNLFPGIDRVYQQAFRHGVDRRHEAAAKLADQLVPIARWNSHSPFRIQIDDVDASKHGSKPFFAVTLQVVDQIPHFSTEFSTFFHIATL